MKVERKNTFLSKGAHICMCCGADEGADHYLYCYHTKESNAQLARDIEAARVVKPYESMADEPVGGPVNHPKHYNNHGSGIECIDVVEHMGFNLGNAIKYIWRAELKGDAIEDLKKAAWYIDREIKKRSR